MKFVKPPEPEDFGEQFVYWEERLGSSDFFGGDSPDSEDFLLFGIVQCHCSVPVPPLQALMQDKRLGSLREWIVRMQDRLVDYPYLYSARYFGNRNQSAKPASSWDQFCFWSGLTTCFVAFPITIPLVIFFRSKVPN